MGMNDVLILSDRIYKWLYSGDNPRHNLTLTPLDPKCWIKIRVVYRSKREGRPRSQVCELRPLRLDTQLLAGHGSFLSGSTRWTYSVVWWQGRVFVGLSLWFDTVKLDVVRSVVGYEVELTSQTHYLLYRRWWSLPPLTRKLFSIDCRAIGKLSSTLRRQESGIESGGTY